jgi:transposase-like protein
VGALLYRGLGSAKLEPAFETETNRRESRQATTTWKAEAIGAAVIWQPPPMKTEKETKMKCPYCHSADITFIKKIGQWLSQYRCNKCSRTFEQ